MGRTISVARHRSLDVDAHRLTGLWDALENVALRVALPFGVLAVWEVASRAGILTPSLLPAPSRVASSFLALLASGELVTSVWASLARVLAGFLLAAVAGLLLGIGLGLSRTFERLLDLVVQVLRPIPPIAWIPLLILWFGIEEASKVAVIFIGAFFPILLNTVHGVRSTDRKLMELGSVVGMTRNQMLAKVILPSALPSILVGARVGLGIAWMCVVAAELIAANSGLGYLITDARLLSRPDVVIAGMLTIGIVGKLMDSFLKLLERRVLRWKTVL